MYIFTTNPRLSLNAPYFSQSNVRKLTGGYVPAGAALVAALAGALGAAATAGEGAGVAGAAVAAAVGVVAGVDGVEAGVVDMVFFLCETV